MTIRSIVAVSVLILGMCAPQLAAPLMADLFGADGPVRVLATYDPPGGNGVVNVDALLTIITNWDACP